MSDPSVRPLPLPDEAARVRIRTDLDTSFLVEAGAGSGKTTELVGRMVALLATGTATVDELAAVTFTRKAAGELRERLQAELERRVAAPPAARGEPEEAERAEAERARLRTALEDIDRAFVGTIHAFCARLLRERPLDVGLDPAFRELPVEERASFHRRFWDAYLERLVREADPALEALAETGLRPAHLLGLFQTLVENPDVDFPADQAGSPSQAEVARIRTELSELVDRGMELMPAREPPRGWDSLQGKIRTLAFTRDVTGWSGTADFFEALKPLCKRGPRGHQITQKRWRDKALAKEFRDRVDAFTVGPDAPANALLQRWYAHCYVRALELAGAAAREFAEHRRRVGVLDFQDLLLLTARLLREHPDARRELGERYRRLLVDEFQDTDPLQAEIMMLLASDPGGREGTRDAPGEDGGDDDAPDTDAREDDAPGGPADWRRAVPRPGALFVVGDPKQSIYRFRRADIQLYEMVKRRFEAVGDVLELTANFRSRPGIGDLVNGLFDREGFFPPEADAEQARFEPLLTRPPEEDVVEEGVFWYAVHPDGRSREAVAEDDAARLASWIRARIDAGERSPGDFMILTRTTHYLDVYARALEARGVPLQVTGAGVGVAHELAELMTVLECMVDPENPVKVLSVLVGLFFGLDLERVTAHRLAGGDLSAVRPGTRGDPEVLEALATLHRWFGWATAQPADVFVSRVAVEVGLLPYAASGDLGSIRAGELAFALDTVRAAALAGEASLPGALEALRSALALSEAEAPLEPGRPGVARLMNLHQAKGLEARVVVLADPSRESEHRPSVHVERDAEGRATGWLRVSERTGGWGGDQPLARPATWEEKEALELRFEAAEQVRLLYVAVTRAREELVVARWVEKPEGSVWSPLDAWVTEHARELELEVVEPPPRPVLELGPEEAGRATEAARRRVQEGRRPSYRHVSVTELAKGGPAPEEETGEGGADPAAGADPGAAGGAATGRASEPGDFRGYSWGSAVHEALAAAAEDPSETALMAACRSHLVEHERPLDDHGEPVELQELLDLVHAVRDSELWRRAEAAERLLAEIPFAARGLARPPEPPEPETVEGPGGGGPERRQLDLFGEPVEAGAEGPSAGRAGPDEGTGAGGGADPELAEVAGPDASAAEPPAVLEGVIDLAFKEEDGWIIADYKTDVGTDPEFPERVARYRRQVELYAEAWASLTGEPVKERVLYFTAQDRVESW